MRKSGTCEKDIFDKEKQLSMLYIVNFSRGFNIR